MGEIKYVRDLADFIEDGSSVGIFGEPGAGKSSFTIRICDKLAERGYTIKYISTDHPSFEIDLTIARWKVNPENFEIHDFFEIAHIEEKDVGVKDIEAILGPGKEVLVIDSLTAFILKKAGVITKKLHKIKSVKEFLEEFKSFLSKNKDKIIISTIDLKLVDKEVVDELKKYFDVNIWIEDIGGKRKVIVFKKGNKIFEGIVGYQGEITW